jgi:hypothetical protein
MIEKIKKLFLANLFLWGILVSLLAFKIFGIVQSNIKTNIAKRHIEVIVATDRNCNDCHLGESFINLFNHSAVRNNDNVVYQMMDRAHIKRW